MSNSCLSLVITNAVNFGLNVIGISNSGLADMSTSHQKMKKINTGISHFY